MELLLVLFHEKIGVKEQSHYLGWGLGWGRGFYELNPYLSHSSSLIIGVRNDMGSCLSWSQNAPLGREWCWSVSDHSQTGASPSDRIHLWAMEPGTNHFISLSLSFFLCTTSPSIAITVEGKGLRAWLIIKGDSF